jgi:hypothetical protein
MQIDVIYAANLAIGDWYAGQVVPDAPTRPVQEILRALEITAKEVRRDAEGIRRVYAESNGMVLSSILASRQVMVIRGPYPGIPSAVADVLAGVDRAAAELMRVRDLGEDDDAADAHHTAALCDLAESVRAAAVGHPELTMAPEPAEDEPFTSDELRCLVASAAELWDNIDRERAGDYLSQRQQEVLDKAYALWVPEMNDTPLPSAPTVTVTYARKHWSLAFSKLPGQKFGPYDLPGAVGQLRVAALLEPIDARNLVLNAAAADDHTATAQTGE